MPYLGSHWSLKKCPQCGKQFDVLDDKWGYTIRKRRDVYFCSWHCKREAETEEEAKKGKPRTEKEAAINELLLSGMEVPEIVRKLGVSRSTVRYYKDRLVTNEDAI